MISQKLFENISQPLTSLSHLHTWDQSLLSFPKGNETIIKALVRLRSFAFSDNATALHFKRMDNYEKIVDEFITDFQVEEV